ncbi:uncharacterized protein LY89DRAFT_464483 [Mollisia scopiformis]|uniref:Uncharacterized protein n=1 Tax=Mollisia scopiformis TaxID=149040 RepID=A0A194XIC6_MOLSC|nr:uncharacterized protein LY89DRAFT_464483 [Mollisia scopiformis]KUJ19879.1 hypothetical protein LY89DRAFT_464483 [Mollisia scopiformis]
MRPVTSTAPVPRASNPPPIRRPLPSITLMDHLYLPSIWPVWSWRRKLGSLREGCTRLDETRLHLSQFRISPWISTSYTITDPQSSSTYPPLPHASSWSAMLNPEVGHFRHEEISLKCLPWRLEGFASYRTRCSHDARSIIKTGARPFSSQL